MLFIHVTFFLCPGKISAKFKWLKMSKKSIVHFAFLHFYSKGCKNVGVKKKYYIFTWVRKLSP